jgi:hypothetical protein
MRPLTEEETKAVFESEERRDNDYQSTEISLS